MKNPFPIFSTLAASGCGPTGDVESSELVQDLEAITALREENPAAINSSDVNTLLTEFTDDVVFLPDDQPPVLNWFVEWSPS